MAEEPTEAERDAISPETVSPMKEVIDTTAPDVLEPAVTSKQPNVGTNQADPSVPPEPISQAAMQPSQPKTQQEITLAELKAQKAALLTSLANLPAIQVLVEEHASSQAGEMVDEEATEKDIFTAANRIVKDHIKLLHEYNELKDVGQGLMGLIADQRGVRIVEVQDEFGIEGQD